ncbi:insulinase family protein, partial [bacterium]|nr:insulinase family protein [bacterium]
KQHLDVQKKVVIEEFKQRYLNVPYGDLYKLMREISYTAHPYKWQTIGKDISHIENADLDIVRDFYKKYYNPNNAILAVSGNIKAEDVFSLSEKIFGQIQNDSKEKISYSTEPLQIENRELKVERDVPTSVIMITFPMCERTNSQFYTFDLLSDILSNGKSSRLYDSLVRNKQVFTGIDAVVSGDDDKGLFMIVGKLSDGVDIYKGEEMIWQELKNLISNPPSEREFQKVKNKNRANATFNNIKITDKALNLAYYAHLDILERINTEKDYYDRVTIQDLTELAQRTFFINKHNILYYLAK